MEIMAPFHVIDIVKELVDNHGIENYLNHGMVHNALDMLLILEVAIIHLVVQVPLVYVNKQEQVGNNINRLF